MELNDLKEAWGNANKQTGDQGKLTSEMIELMTEKRFYSKTKRIAYPEIAGVIICIISVVFIGLNFKQLDTQFLKAAGMMAILMLLTLSVISLISLRYLNINVDFNNTYADTLRRFAVQKLQFFKLQKLNVTLCYILLVSVIILMSKLLSGRDLSESKYFWLFSFTFGYLFLSFYSNWVSKYYKKTVTEAEDLLKELQSS